MHSLILSLAFGAVVSAAPQVPALQVENRMALSHVPARAPSTVPSDNLLDRPARLRIDSAPLGEALRTLHETSGVPMVFSPSQLPQHEVSCDCLRVSVGTALDRILSMSGARVVSGDRQIVIVPEQARSQTTNATAMASAPPPSHRPVPTRPSGLDRVRATAVQLVGTLTGRVTDAGSGQPLSAVQVYIEAIDLGVLTQQDGRYLMSGVPAGTHSVSVQRIGYTTMTQEVTLTDGQTVVTDFRLDQEALRLDEVVVTGTAGGQRRRAIGNVVGSVEASTVTQSTPIVSMDDLLRGREPGLNLNRSSGNIGAGSEIRIRGTGTLSLGDTPLIFVDGIRVDNTTGVGPSVADGRQATRLDDFNPEEIESIEIIKGPAAATLYGTEASAGVIQIITKKGRVGTPQFDLMVRQGANWLPNPAAWTADQTNRFTGEVFNIYEVEEAAGRPFFQDGHNQSYNVGMRGGTDAVRYFLSADYHDNEGIVDYNYDERTSIRGNIGVVPNEQFSLDMSTGYITGFSSFLQQRSAWGLMESAVWANPSFLGTSARGFYSATPEEMALMEATREYRRFTASATLTHTPFSWLTHRLTVGLDDTADENRILVPRQTDAPDHVFGALSLGELSLERPIIRSSTLDYAISGRYDLNEDIRFTSSVGAQYYSTERDDVRTLGRVFPAPPITNLSGVESSEPDHIQVQNKSIGFYAQEEVAWRDRVFLTGAVRGDDNSAFGAGYDAAVYPKFSATWVVSEEAFWDWGNVVNSLRLRSAWGRAGRQPNTFAAVTLYSPQLGAGGTSGIEPSVKGNPDVGPEVSTELELGFDAAFLNNRITTEFTYYTQKVKDALLSQDLAPSSGFPGSQSANLGQLSNWGWELSVAGTVFDMDQVSLDLGVSVSHNENRIDDMGGTPESDGVRDGWPYPVLSRRVPLSADWVDPVNGIGGAVTNVMCDGGTPDLRRGGSPVSCIGAPRLLIGTRLPGYEWNFDGTLTFLDNFQLRGLVEMRRDFWLGSFLISCRHWCFPNAPQRYQPTDPIYVAALPGPYLNIQGNLVNHDYDASFAKLRELSLTYTLPGSLLDRLPMSRATLSVSGRNLWTIWQRQKDVAGIDLVDPELNQTSSSSSIAPIPPLRSFLVTMRVSF